MTGWLILILLCAATALLLWRFGGFRGGALTLLCAAMLVALAGYTWQGRPGLGGSPVAASVSRPPIESGFMLMRDEFLPQFDSASRWLILADSFHRRGNTEDAIGVIRAGLRSSPRSMSLWTGLGNALVLHGGGTMNAAAELAYRRAIAIAPDHPAPRFFYGMSLVEAGQAGEGERVWSALLASAPADASWRLFVAERLALLRKLIRIEARQHADAPRP